MSEDNIQSNQELENISDDDSSSEENLSLSEEKPEEEILKIEDVEPSEFESSITNQQSFYISFLKLSYTFS